MAGPWEKYAAPQESGPWQKYAAPKAPAPAPEQKPAEAPPPQGGSFLDPLAAGITMDFNDEIKGAVRGGARYLFGDNPGKSFGDLYTEERDAARQDQAAYRARHPVLSPTLEIAGALLTTPYLPGGTTAKGAGIGTRMARGAMAGGTYGAISGAGAADGDMLDRVAGAAEGGALGATVGAATPLAVRGAQAVGRGVRDAARRGAGPVRGVFNAEREAAKRVGLAMQADQAVPQKILSPSDEIVARATGVPVYNVDRGGETTRALARSAANTSPQARAIINDPIDNRYTSQGNRVVDKIRALVGSTTNPEQRAQLEARAALENRPAYLRAFNAPGAASMWDEGFQQMASAPIVQDAMRKATVTGRNDAAKLGFPPMKTFFAIDKNGGLSLADPNVTPSLQFWNQVKINLDKVGTREARDWSRVLREHLDDLVPEYAQARAGAAQFFKARDMVNAGEEAVMSGMRNEEIASLLAKAKPAERQLFKEAFADKIVDMVSKASDRRNVINQVYLGKTNERARDRIRIVLGDKDAKKLEAYLRVEDFIDKARTAMGNSTSMRQLVEIGLVGGGAGAYGYTTGNWKTAGSIFAADLMRHGMGRIDAKVATKVAEMLMSEDPKVLNQGLELVARNDRIMAALRLIDVPTGIAAQKALREPMKVYLNAGERDQQMGAPGDFRPPAP